MNATVEDMEKLRHMLGCDPQRNRKHWGFRNYYVAAPGLSDTPSLDRLVAAGLVVKVKLSLYHATRDGCLAVGMTDAEIARMDPQP